MNNRYIAASTTSHLPSPFSRTRHQRPESTTTTGYETKLNKINPTRHIHSPCKDGIFLQSSLNQIIPPYSFPFAAPLDLVAKLCLSCSLCLSFFIFIKFGTSLLVIFLFSF